MGSVHVELLEKELWKKFSTVTNEMIVTKTGRRMFPIVKLKISGLNPKAFYEMKLEFVQIGNHRWKYMSGGWQHGGKAESQGGQSIYKHPDSPNLGEFWMKREGIHFSKVKLTNKPNPANEQVVLNSLHKYQPLVQIIQLDSTSEPCQIFKFDFPEAEFIAVTAYQNEEITSLKIRFNPFAKAFQDTRERPLDMFPSAYNNSNHLSSLSHLNSSNIGVTNNGNGNVMLGSSASNGSLVISSSTNHNSSNYLERTVKLSPNSLTGSNESPNSNNSPSNLLNTASLGNNYANPYTAHGYLSASAAVAVACNNRSTPTTFSMNNYYGPNQNATYQDLTNSLGNLSNTLATYNGLQQPDTMVSSNSPTHSYNNLILNTTSTTTANNPSANYNNLVNSQSLSLTSGEQSTTSNNSSNGSNNSFLIKTSNSPITADLSSPNTYLSSSSSSSSSSLSSSSYCERYTPLRSHRSIPYTNIKSAVGHPAATYYYNSWTQQSSDLTNWTITPEGCYPSVN